MSSNHIENSVDLKLQIIKEIDADGILRVRTKEFDNVLFYKRHGKKFKNVKFFNVSEDEFFYACKVIDGYVEEKYKGSEILTRYLKEDIIPEELNDRSNLPVTIRPYWDILFKVNQNKWCNYQVMSTPNLLVSLFAGYKAISPFKHDSRLIYMTLNFKGAIKDIDEFINEFRL